MCDPNNINTFLCRAGCSLSVLIWIRVSQQMRPISRRRTLIPSLKNCQKSTKLCHISLDNPSRSTPRFADYKMSFIIIIKKNVIINWWSLQYINLLCHIIPSSLVFFIDFACKLNGRTAGEISRQTKSFFFWRNWKHWNIDGAIKIN